MKRDIYIDFILGGTNMAPKDITQQLGLVPDIELLKGERNPKRVLPRKNLWSIESTVNSNNIEEHWNELKNKLLPLQNKIKAILKDGEASMVIVINTEGYVLNLFIPYEMSMFMGYIDGVIDIDHMQ